MLSFLFRGAYTPLQALIQLRSSYGVKGCMTQGPAPTQQFISKYSLWGSNPRPMAHKTIALTTELREPTRNCFSKSTLPTYEKKVSNSAGALAKMHRTSWLTKELATPAIAQLVEHLTVDHCSNQMVSGSILGGRTLAENQKEENEMGGNVCPC